MILPIIDLNAHYYKLPNGLEVYIVPKKGKKTYATYSTKYGAKDIEFVPFKSKKMKAFPLGIAHFLEHKLFEQEDGIDIMETFAKRGADVNAYTSYTQTCYEFSGPSQFYENLETLLSFVQSPYFTNENVEKEKGIIEQEINMYNDSPYAVMHYESLKCAFKDIPYNKKIAGDKENIFKISKEDLYECYNTFYHPSNMFVTIVGNVDPDKTIELIKKNQEKRNLINVENIKRKKYNESNEVAINKRLINMNVEIPKILLGYKINIYKINIDRCKLSHILRFIFNIKAGKTSLLVEDLKEKKIIDGGLLITTNLYDNYALATISADTYYDLDCLKEIKRTLKDLTITESDLERNKRSAICSFVSMTDDIYVIAYKINNDVIEYNKFYNDKISLINSITLEEVNEVIKNINLDNSFTCKIVKSDKNETNNRNSK